MNDRSPDRAPPARLSEAQPRGPRLSPSPNEREGFLTGLLMRHPRLLLGLCLALLCIALALVPQVDLAVARFFYSDGRFVGDMPTGHPARAVARGLPFVILGGFALTWAVGLLRTDRRRIVRGRSLIWLILSAALGPGLVVDGLKDISHRPRPVHVTEFGGDQAFRPFYRFDGACGRNCAFPSGEAAAAFWTLAPASLAPPPLRPLAIGAAVLFGLATSLLRLAFGGHFLSDVVFAGILTIVVLAALRRMLLSRPAEDAANKPGDAN